MKRSGRWGLVLLFVVFAGLACAEGAPIRLPFDIDEEIDVKGVRIGMTQQEIEAVHPSWRGFTIGGVQARYATAPVLVRYRDGKLSEFSFAFKSEDFDDVLAAVSTKYPAVLCDGGVLASGARPSIGHIACTLRSPSSVLFVVKHGDGENFLLGILMLRSRQATEESMAARDRLKDDI